MEQITVNNYSDPILVEQKKIITIKINLMDKHQFRNNLLI